MRNEDYLKKLKGLEMIAGMLSPKYPYHNTEHNRDVSRVARVYGQLEQVSEYNIFILGSAGLIHDLIYVVGRTDNEEKSVETGSIILSKLGYSIDDVKTISRLVLATKLPTNPGDLLEMIICDADKDHLGRDDFWEKSERLRKERNINKERWYISELPRFLRQIKYYTYSAQKLRGHGLEKHLQEVSEWQNQK